MGLLIVLSLTGVDRFIVKESTNYDHDTRLLNFVFQQGILIFQLTGTGSEVACYPIYVCYT